MDFWTARFTRYFPAFDTTLNSIEIFIGSANQDFFVQWELIQFNSVPEPSVVALAAAEKSDHPSLSFVILEERASWNPGIICEDLQEILKLLKILPSFRKVEKTRV